MSDETTSQDAELAKLKSDLAVAVERSEQLQSQLNDFADQLIKGKVRDHRMQAVLAHHLPDVDVDAELRHAVGDVKFDDDGNPTGELSYRPAVQAQPPAEEPPPAGNTVAPAAPAPLTLPQRAEQDTGAAQATGTTGSAAWDLRH